MNPNAIKKNDEIKNNTLQANENHLWLLKHINPKNKQKNPFPKKNPKKLKCCLTFVIFNSHKIKIIPNKLYIEIIKVNYYLHHINIENIIYRIESR